VLFSAASLGQEKVWDVLIAGITHVIKINREGGDGRGSVSVTDGTSGDEGGDDGGEGGSSLRRGVSGLLDEDQSLRQSFFNNDSVKEVLSSIPEALKARFDEEGQSYKNFHKLALTIVDKQAENDELKKQIKEYESTIGAGGGGSAFASMKSGETSEKYRDRQLPVLPKGSVGTTLPGKLSTLWLFISSFSFFFFFRLTFSCFVVSCPSASCSFVS
jgi:hypothetical protein